MSDAFKRGKKVERLDLGGKLIAIGGGRVLDFSLADVDKADFILVLNKGKDVPGLPADKEIEWYVQGSVVEARTAVHYVHSLCRVVGAPVCVGMALCRLFLVS